MTSGGLPRAAVDAALAVATGVVLVEEVLVSASMSPRPPLTAAVLVVALGVGCWRRWPGPAAVLAALGMLAAGALTTSEFPPQLTLIPVLLLLFNAAARLRGRQGTAYAVVTLVLVVTGHVLAPDGDAADFWPWLLWGLAWGGGVVVRHRTDVARAEAARATLYEMEARTSAADATARERERIARELHDVVAHSVSVMVVQAGAERLRLGDQARETGRALAAIEDAGRQALTELRVLLGLLGHEGDPVEDGHPLPRLSDLVGLVDRLRETGMPVDLRLTPPGLLTGRGDLPDAVELAAFRIAQESLTNVVRHAGPVETLVHLAETGPDLTIHVESGGAARSGDQGPGRGIAGMTERARALGGELTAERRGDRFVVCARLPLRLDRGVRR